MPSRFICLALSLAVFLLFVWRFQFLCDDGYISFRYSYNLAAGNGLVYNLGVTPPVEGYTEFLWVLILAVGQRMGLSPEGLSQALTILAGLTLLIRVHSSAQRQFGQAPLSVWLTTLLCASCIPLAVWSTSGMGTMLFVLACYMTVDYLVGFPSGPKLIPACLAASATVLLRADGALWVAFVGVSGFAYAVVNKDRAWARTAIALSSASLLVFLLHTLWRWNYYGDWLPNTARAKLGVSSFTVMRGAHYVASFGLVFPGLLLAWLATPLLGFGKLKAPTWIAWASVPLIVSYAVFTGGDFMCFGRFLLPCLPLLLLAFGASTAPHLDSTAPSKGRPAAIALAGLVLALGLPPGWNQACTRTAWLESMAFRYNARKPDGSVQVRTEREQWQAMKSRAKEWKQLGRAVALHTAPEDSLVAGAIGALGYFSGRRMFDQYGLVSPEVLKANKPKVPKPADRRSPGHDRQVPATFFLAQKPDWLGARLLLPGEKAPRGLRPGLDRVVDLSPANGFAADTRLMLVSGRQRN